MLTVVIPTIKYTEKLLRAIKSATLLHKNVTVIVVDNSLHGIFSELEYFTNKINDFKIIRNNNQLDMASNWNKCFEVSETKYTLMLHDDDYFDGITDLNFLNSNSDLYILPANLLTGSNLTKLGNLESYRNNLNTSSLTQFPGVQRQIWKTSKLKYNKFNPEFFPVFDYIWYSLQVDNLPTIEYCSDFFVTIENHSGQTTNNIFWSFSVFKVLIKIILNKKNYSHKKFYYLTIKHLLDRLIKSIHSDLLRVLRICR